MSVTVVELTAQFVASEGNHIVASIVEKRCLDDFAFLRQPVEESRRRVSLPAAEGVDSEQSLGSVSIAAYSHFFSPSTSICFSSTATRAGSAVGGSLCASDSVCFQFQIVP